MVRYKDIFGAAAMCDLEAVKLFVEEEGVELRERNSEGDTVAHIAAKNYDMEILKYALKKDITLLEMPGKHNMKLLETAIGMNSRVMVKFLVNYCNADIYNFGDADHPATYVHLTAEVCSFGVFKFFIEEKKIDVNFRDAWQQPLAFSAARGCCLDIIKYIVDQRNADVTTMIDIMGRNILCQSAVSSDLVVPKYLLDVKGLPVDTNNTYIIEDALVYAAKFKNNKIDDFVEYFVENKHMNINNGLNSSPLHQAAEIGMLKWVKYFVQHGADIGRKDIRGRTPLQVATDKGVIEYLQELENERRPRRSLAGVPKHDANLWIRRVPDIRGPSSLLDHSENLSIKKFANTRAFGIHDFLVLATAYAVSGLRTYQSLPSPQDTIRSRIDPVAIDAVHNYSFRE